LALAKLGYFVVATVITKIGFNNLDGKVGCVLISDVTNQKDVDTLSKTTQVIMDEKKLSLWAVVNNAGIAAGMFLDLTSMETYQKVMDVNYFGIIRVVKSVLYLLKQTKHSRVINISSVAGYQASGIMGAYCGKLCYISTPTSNHKYPLIFSYICAYFSL
jgi:NAD(P)-dependent dehydrogenase (short-subunit alcohol dehydrogenase family)